jgi:outer membrane protein
MRQLKTLVAAIILFGMTQVQAQTKIAHVDTQEIMTKMPAMIDAQKQLEKLRDQYAKEYETMGTEFKSKLDRYEAEAEKTSKEINEERGKEMQDMDKRIKDFGETAQKSLKDKETDLAKPLMEKIRASILKVAKAKGYSYVADKASFIVAEGPDMTAEVKKDLGF